MDNMEFNFESKSEDEALYNAIKYLARCAFEEAAKRDPELKRKLDYMHEVEELSDIVRNSLNSIKHILDDFNENDSNPSSIKRNILIHQQIAMSLGFSMDRIATKSDHIKNEYGDLYQTGGDDNVDGSSAD